MALTFRCPDSKGEITLWGSPRYSAGLTQCRTQAV